MKRSLTFGMEGEMGKINLANVLMLLSRGDHVQESSSPGRVFECKTCNRCFSSFQALGGHRASHKKLRLIGDGQDRLQGSTAPKPKVHECSVCGLEFAIGQALGGHMRRHRATAGGFRHGLEEENSNGKRVVCLDLNLPPLEKDKEHRTMIFGIELVDKTPLVDCCFH